MRISPETSATVHQSTLHNIPQARRSRSHGVSYLSELPYIICNAIKTTKFARATLTNTHVNINHGTHNAAKQLIFGA